MKLTLIFAHTFFIDSSRWTFTSVRMAEVRVFLSDFMWLIFTSKVSYSKHMGKSKLSNFNAMQIIG